MVGQIDLAPDTIGVTEPIVWSIENEVALVVVHKSADNEPV